jgi:hypothetical protein
MTNRCGDCRERVLRELTTGDGRTVCRKHNDKPVRAITDACGDHNPLTIIQGAIPSFKFQHPEQRYHGIGKYEERKHNGI